MTMTHKPVMVATDLSARCDRPIERAVKLAQDWSVKLIVLHVLDPALPENPKAKWRLLYKKVWSRTP